MRKNRSSLKDIWNQQILPVKIAVIVGILVILAALIFGSALHALIAAVGVIVFAALVILGFIIGGHLVSGSETRVRKAWSVDAGKLIANDEKLKVEIHQADVKASVTVLRMIPAEVKEEGFTFYDENVQERLTGAINETKKREKWTPESPMTVLNPFGTGSNGLLVYFTTANPCQVSYTIHVDEEGIPDFTRKAPNDGEDGFTKEHEFLMIGLIPGKLNKVTMTVTGSWGRVRHVVSFDIQMPELISGYLDKLKFEDGPSTQPLSDGLFSLMRVNGTMGYVFFYDNSGILRYEWVLEGYGMDRILHSNGQIITSVSAKKIAQINRLGCVTRVYNLGKYDMHHDLNFGAAGKLVALAEDTARPEQDMEDMMVEVDLESGECSLLVDYTVLMADFYRKFTRPIQPTDPFLWFAGKWDWIHLNSVQWMAPDSVIVSSRETNTIIKISDLHGKQYVEWMIGDPGYWDGTGYERCLLKATEPFLWQYGQHDVQYAGPGPEKGTYYLTMFNNNFYGNSSRIDRYRNAELDSRVGEALYESKDIFSYEYTYLVNEPEHSVTLVKSAELPYSAIVSNVDVQKNKNVVSNSGVDMSYCECDEMGRCIRRFHYTCKLQNYRAVKSDYLDYWFAK